MDLRRVLTRRVAGESPVGMRRHGTSEPRIFICYRREDANQAARAIYERLQIAFGKSGVFLDHVGFRAGQNWREKTRRIVEAALAVVVIIDKDWVDIAKQRFQDESDPVRRELELSRPGGAVRAGGAEKLVIPVLIDDTSVPASSVLESFRSLQHGHSTFAILSWLFEKNAQRVRFDTSFNADMDLLIQALAEHPGIDLVPVPTEDEGVSSALTKAAVLDGAVLTVAAVDVLLAVLLGLRAAAPLYPVPNPLRLVFAVVGIGVVGTGMVAVVRPRLLRIGLVTRPWQIAGIVILLAGASGMFMFDIWGPVRISWVSTGLVEACVGSKYFVEQVDPPIQSSFNPTPCTIFERGALAVTLRAGLRAPDSTATVTVTIKHPATTTFYVLVNESDTSAVQERVANENGETFTFQLTPDLLESVPQFTMRLFPAGAKGDDYEVFATNRIDTRRVGTARHAGTTP